MCSMAETPIPHDPQNARAFAKWEHAALAGFQIVPSVLLKYQTRLELSPTDILVLLNILSFWWYSDEPPFPKVSTIAKRMGVTTRTVQRSIEKLTAQALIRRARKTRPNGDAVEVIDLTGLVTRLGSLAKQDRDYKPRLPKKELAHEAAVA